MPGYDQLDSERRVRSSSAKDTKVLVLEVIRTLGDLGMAIGEAGRLAAQLADNGKYESRRGELQRLGRTCHMVAGTVSALAHTHPMLRGGALPRDGVRCLINRLKCAMVDASTIGDKGADIVRCALSRPALEREIMYAVNAYGASGPREQRPTATPSRLAVDGSIIPIKRPCFADLEAAGSCAVPNCKYAHRGDADYAQTALHYQLDPRGPRSGRQRKRARRQRADLADRLRDESDGSDRAGARDDAEPGRRDGGHERDPSEQRDRRERGGHDDRQGQGSRRRR